MKKISLLSILLAGFLVFASCDKGEVGPVMSSEPGSPSITSPESGNSYTLSSDQKTDTLFTMDWTNPDYGFDAAPEYVIQMDVEGNNFANPIQVASVNGTSHSFTVEDINNILISNGFPADVGSNLQFRLIGTLGDEEKTSDPITLTMSPYPPFPSIYVSGNYQSSSSYDLAPALVSQNDDNSFEGYVYFENDNSEFTFTSARGSGTSWGDDGSDGTLEQDGVNIQVASAGYYRFNVDMDNMTYSMNATEWGLIGSATADGWNSDQDMTYNKESKVWTITTDLTAAEMKFRANDAWNLDYGDNESDGFLDIGGDNIVVNEAGNYTVTLDLGGYFRTYELKQN